MNRKPFEITEIRDEATNVKTFLFDKNANAKPGQYVIAWLRDQAEKPFSLSYTKPLGITVKKVGSFTSALFDLEEGDTILIRGPYGRGFPIGHLIDLHIVAGGTGVAPTALLADYTIKYGVSSKVISFLGVKSSNDLIFEERLKKVGEVHISTEDGSKGKRGLVTDLLKEYKFPEWWKSRAAVCGPEKMMYNSVKILENHLDEKHIYLSFERLMKCGRGLCGSCGFGEYKICVDGPVLKYENVKNVPDFGNFERDRYGRKIPL